LNVLGKDDVVDFPGMGLFSIPVKVDTGAYTSTIHYQSVTEQNGKLVCIIKIGENKVEEVFDEYKIRKVKSSNGQSEERYAVKTSILLFGKVYKIELTLSNRTDMRYPVLIGRKFLKKKFIVDVSKRNTSQNYSKN
jgi:hypothetical protein